MHIWNILEFFEKYKCPGIAFFLQRSRYVSKKQPCLRRTGPQDDLLLLSSWFHFFYLIFSAPISFSFCFQISPFLLLFFYVLSQAFIKHSRTVFIYIYIHSICRVYIYISLRKFMDFFLNKKSDILIQLDFILIKFYIFNYKNRYKTSNKVLLYHTGNYKQYRVINYNGK